MACSLDDEQLAARRAEWQSLATRGLVQKIDEEGGFTATYRGDDETARVLASLVQAELECCPDIGWNLERDGELIRLRVRYGGPGEAAPRAERADQDAAPRRRRSAVGGAPTNLSE